MIGRLVSREPFRLDHRFQIASLSCRKTRTASRVSALMFHALAPGGEESLLLAAAILLIVKPAFALIQRKEQKHTCRHCGDDQNCSHNCNFHCVGSHGTIAPQFFIGQRKPFKPPSNTLVLIRDGSAQNSWPHCGHVRR